MADTGLRERRAARTRDAIVTAAYALFAERGFQATTVDEIAARAEVAPRTFFRYFPTKEAVLFARTAEQREQIAEALAARPMNEHPFTSLTTVIAAFARDLEHQREELRLRQKIAEESAAVLSYERTLLEAETARTLAGFVAERLGVAVATDPRPQTWAALVMSTFRIAFHLWLDRGCVGSLRLVFDRTMAAAAEATALLGATAVERQGRHGKEAR